MKTILRSLRKLFSFILPRQEQWIVVPMFEYDQLSIAARVTAIECSKHVMIDEDNIWHKGFTADTKAQLQEIGMINPQFFTKNLQDNSWDDGVGCSGDFDWQCVLERFELTVSDDVIANIKLSAVLPNANNPSTTYPGGPWVVGIRVYGKLGEQAPAGVMTDADKESADQAADVQMGDVNQAVIEIREEMTMILARLQTKLQSEYPLLLETSKIIDGIKQQKLQFTKNGLPIDIVRAEVAELGAGAVKASWSKAERKLHEV